jgi:very-short-patch-repair endonuclease
MSGKVPNRRDESIGRLADRQHGVVSRAQLGAAGISEDVIDYALRTGRLRPLFRGVYAAGHRALKREGWWMAALLACGERAVLSHLTAAVAWGFRRAPIKPIEVIVSGDRGRELAGILPHRMRLQAAEVMVVDGLRITTPARTIVDCASTLTGRPLRELVERAQDLRRFKPEDITATLDRVPRRRGCRQLTDLLLLIQPDEDGARSHLERLFLKAMRRARLPPPDVNYAIAGRQRDFVWSDARLVIEVDGNRWHSSPQAKRRDHQRDRELTALGWRPARFTYEDVAFEPDAVAREVKTLL